MPGRRTLREIRCSPLLVGYGGQEKPTGDQVGGWVDFFLLPNRLPCILTPFLQKKEQLDQIQSTSNFLCFPFFCFNPLMFRLFVSVQSSGPRPWATWWRAISIYYWEWRNPSLGKRNGDGMRCSLINLVKMCLFGFFGWVAELLPYF